MTFPGGAPGGYPGQGPQQPPPFPGPNYGPPAGGGLKLGIPAIAHLVVAGLGLLNFFLGFATITDGGSAYFEGLLAVPALFLIAGLLSLPAILPGDNKKPGIPPAAFALGSWLTVLFFVFSTEADLGVGTIMYIIFGLLQTAAAAGGYLLDVGIIKPPAPKPQFGPPPGGQFGPPSGQFPVPPPPPQQQQPGPFGAPPGQQTTFAPQQGQFGQPPQPGTPPGGYPQQG